MDMLHAFPFPPSIIVSHFDFKCYNLDPMHFYFIYRSSSCHTWDAFQLADASFRLYCLRNNCVLPDGERVDEELGPNLFGEPPRITVDIPEIEDAGEDEESTSGSLPAIKIYDDDVSMRFLVCGVASSLVTTWTKIQIYCVILKREGKLGPHVLLFFQDARLLSPLEDGLNALLSIEVSSPFGNIIF